MNEVLHAVRIKGVATPEALEIATGLEAAAVEATLAELEAGGLVVRRPSKRRTGWVVTEAGRERHARWLAEAHEADTTERLDAPYAEFLAVNGEVKGLSARWQGASDDATRFELIEAIEGVHAKAVPALDGAATAVPRYGRYRDRLGTALERLDEDPSYFVSTRVDSYHTVWFECHEDFLLVLGRTRAEEGSE
jgi:DNA-binding MarR family transcriptional regulator